MRYGYGGGVNVGSYCHWCGELVVSTCVVRSGRHLFCRNGRKCQQAHARALNRYKANVTDGGISPGPLASSSGPGGNAKPVKRSASSSAEISAARSSRGNVKGRRK